MQFKPLMDIDLEALAEVKNRVLRCHGNPIIWIICNDLFNILDKER